MNFLMMIFLVFSLIFTLTKASCIDENNKQVDWYVIYKLPHLEGSSNDAVQAGLGYAYIDSNNKKWSPKAMWINTSTNALSYTLNSVYQFEDDNHFHVFYNDEWPLVPGHKKKNYFTNGHTKGVFAGDKQQGFWLIHSLPRFPPRSKEGQFVYPHNGIVYGQTFLCLSVQAANYDAIAKLLFQNQPWIYETSSSDAPIVKTHPTLESVMRKEHVKQPPWSTKVTFATAAGERVVAFGKAAQFGHDLYDSLVAPSMREELWVESWRHGNSNLKSNCSATYHVLNILNLSVASQRFTIEMDHSKWAFAPNSNVVCIGDINRERSQFHRGGGAACLMNDELWEAFKKIIVNVDKCDEATVLFGQRFR